MTAVDAAETALPDDAELNTRFVPPGDVVARKRKGMARADRGGAADDATRVDQLVRSLLIQRGYVLHYQPGWILVMATPWSLAIAKTDGGAATLHPSDATPAPPSHLALSHRSLHDLHGRESRHHERPLEVGRSRDSTQRLPYMAGHAAHLPYMARAALSLPPSLSLCRPARARVRGARAASARRRSSRGSRRRRPRRRSRARCWRSRPTSSAATAAASTASSSSARPTAATSGASSAPTTTRPRA